MELRPEHYTTLHVLAFLFFRMGRMESAGRIYAALAAMAPNAAQPPDWRTLAGQAAVSIELENGEAALAQVRAAKDAANFPPDAPENAVLTLMHAKALWLCGNRDEARVTATALVHPEAQKAAS